MDSILQEMYHGMIHPEEEYQPADVCRQARKKMTAKQAALLEKLRRIDSDTHREIIALFEEENAADAMDMEESYIQGMRMGARLALALLKEKA